MKLSARFRKSAAAVSMAAVFVLAVFAAAGCGSRGAETEDMGVQLMEVMRQDLSESITLNGTVEGENRVNYSSSASGEKYFFAQRGNPFQVGVDVRLHF